MICTFYAHILGFDTIVSVLKQKFPKSNLILDNHGEHHTVEVDIKGGLFTSSSKVYISYREKQNPSYQLLSEDQCPLAQNLKGLHGYIYNLPTSNENIKQRFLQKILTTNCEFSIKQSFGNTKEIKELIYTLAQTFDAFLFVQPGTSISKSNGQHFLDKNLNLITDNQGNCEVSELEINVDAKYFDHQKVSILDDQRSRRSRSEKICNQYNVPIYKNPNMLFVESETTAKIRSKDEIVNRAIALCFVELKSESPEKNLQVILKINTMFILSSVHWN